MINIKKKITCGDYNLDISQDKDGQLTIYVKHDSNSNIFDVGEDLSLDNEFGIRLTCNKIEKEYIKLI